MIWKMKRPLILSTFTSHFTDLFFLAQQSNPLLLVLLLLPPSSRLVNIVSIRLISVLSGVEMHRTRNCKSGSFIFLEASIIGKQHGHSRRTGFPRYSKYQGSYCLSMREVWRCQFPRIQKRNKMRVRHSLRRIMLSRERLQEPIWIWPIWLNEWTADWEYLRP